jgi:orotate phosphoribosyltransferase
MDRQERATDDPADRRSGVQYVEQALGLQVLSIATLADLMAFLGRSDRAPALAAHAAPVRAYRDRYGV